MNSIYILLGANLGDSLQQILDAKQKLSEKLGTIIKESSIYESAAWGVEDQPTFLNQVLLLETTHGAEKSLAICQSIENELGRVRKIKWGARIIDVDILYYNDEIIQTEQLTVPHPYIQERKFTLMPLVEIAPDFIHPIFKETQQQILENCQDPLFVEKLKI